MRTASSVEEKHGNNTSRYIIPLVSEYARGGVDLFDIRVHMYLLLAVFYQ